MNTETQQTYYIYIYIYITLSSDKMVSIYKTTMHTQNLTINTIRQSTTDKVRYQIWVFWMKNNIVELYTFKWVFHLRPKSLEI